MSLIDVEKLKEHIGIDRNSDCKKCQYCDSCRYIEESCFSLDDICEFIDEQPIVDAVPVNHAKWIHHPSEKEWDVCSNCEIGTKRREITVSYITEYSYRFCPNCGAKMDVEWCKCD